MTVEDIQKICRIHPAVTEDIKWEDHLCFSVGGKMFLITSPDQVPCTASIKVADEEFEEISSREGFMPAPYLARYKWVFIDNINRLSKKEWVAFISRAHSLIASKLPASTRKKLGII